MTGAAATPATEATSGGCPFGAGSAGADAAGGQRQAHGDAAGPGAASGTGGGASMSYGSYLRVPELLALQSQRVSSNHDEMLFVIIHQAYELWFRQLLHELDRVIGLMQVDEVREAHRLMTRVHQIERLLVEQMHVLETMTPRDFFAFRDLLRPASGFQSAQFREVELLMGLRSEVFLKPFAEGSDERRRLLERWDGPTLPGELFALLRRAGFALPLEVDDSNRDASVRALLPLFTEMERWWDIYQLSEALVAHDQWIHTWRYHHIRVVERIIGHKMGTGGSPGVAYLETTLRHRAFDLLIEARSYLDEADPG